MTAETSKPGAASPNELERLRDILYGEQARVTEDRLAGLETRAAALEEQLASLAKKLGDEKVSRDTFGEMLIELGQRLKAA
ncbi:MAG: hypothetical protein HN413_11875 [Chloroflexi bacterium]|jgi:uncharacterized coiled-coil protein SlyX|nr:hypothetical protein [Chloroflexota bacterium]